MGLDDGEDRTNGYPTGVWWEVSKSGGRRPTFARFGMSCPTSGCVPCSGGPSLGALAIPLRLPARRSPVEPERLGSGRESFPAQPFFRAPEAFFAVFLVADAALRASSAAAHSFVV